ncbi:hypothetical protein [Hanstruepera flava]|uniref:hypothetical protein n=1 Tax=Hanstruepera flava TaxID=2930218 RepID=UPI0020281D79|nr:hypothetical protein [Hanstruepera flava]
MRKSKLLIGFLAIAFLMSISPISYKNESSNDKIVGTWELERLQTNYTDGTFSEKSFTKCYDRVRHIYNSDGTLNYIFPGIDNNTGKCHYNDTEFWTGTWEKIGDGKYKTSHIQKYPNSNKPSRYTETTIIYTFSRDGKTLKKLMDFKKAGIDFDTESNNPPISELATYVRIK